MALREENFVVLHSGSWNTKAGINVVDTNKPPHVVGLSQHISEITTDTLVTFIVIQHVARRLNALHFFFFLRV
jgi:hypothetical protein